MRHIPRMKTLPPEEGSPPDITMRWRGTGQGWATFAALMMVMELSCTGHSDCGTVA
jgi:hypothetical protein